jgi:ubiquinone/menaquinone biosynthesis C-methylase UbiE
MSSLTAFAGSVPANYDKYLGPLLFEPYALDLIERLKNDLLQNVLEIACGTGRVTRHLLPILTHEGNLLATDLNPDMIALAKSRVIGEHIQWQVADAQQLPFDPNSFDHVICQFGVMFFPDKDAAFSEVYKVLQPGGKFIFSVWDNMMYNPRVFVLNKVMDELFKEEAPDFLKKGPYSFFDKDEIRDKLLKAGFQDISIEIVQKTTNLKNVDEVIIGFVDGSPLSSFLINKPAAIQDEVRKRLREELNKQIEQYSSTMPLQALVIEAIKEK